MIRVNESDNAEVEYQKSFDTEGELLEYLDDFESRLRDIYHKYFPNSLLAIHRGSWYDNYRGVTYYNLIIDPYLAKDAEEAGGYISDDILLSTISIDITASEANIINVHLDGAVLIAMSERYTDIEVPVLEGHFDIDNEIPHLWEDFCERLWKTLRKQYRKGRLKEVPYDLGLKLD